MALEHWLQLSLTSGIGPILIQRLIEAAGSAQAACEATISVLQGIEGIGSAKARRIHSALREARDQVPREIDKAHAQNVGLICPDDPHYPPLLRSIHDPPAVLYIRGDLEPRDLNGIAIVGSRKCSQYGREQADRFAALLCGAGMTVISGGARGIDSAAHRGALSHPQGRTLAVLGSGLDVPYPPENEPLFRQIAERGAVLSEYAMGTAPLAENFPRRNRIVSGMSRGVLVIEADEKSGALITARQACDDHGRPVFALPGRVDNPLSNGPHQLLRDGAILAARLEDILDGLSPLPQNVGEPMLFAQESDSVESWQGQPAREASSDHTQVARATPSTLSDRQQLILEHVDGATHVDGLIERTALPAQVVLQELTMLSLKGVIKRIDGQTYAKR